MLVVDFDGFALRDNSPATGKLFATTLQAHYPERLTLMVLYDAPWLFSTCARPTQPPRLCRAAPSRHPQPRRPNPGRRQS